MNGNLPPGAQFEPHAPWKEPIIDDDLDDLCPECDNEIIIENGMYYCYECNKYFSI